MFGEGRQCRFASDDARTALPGKLAERSFSDPPSFAGRVKHITEATQPKAARPRSWGRSVAVATAGVIAFVALMVPTLVRSFVGQSHRGAVVGSALMFICCFALFRVIERQMADTV